jgi:two-component system phosphate regulon response regulator PhoB
LRSLVYRYGDLFSFGRALGQADQELALPEGESVGDGEWVLAIFEIGERRRATAAAARGMDKGDGTVALGFERRDWERLHTFAEAKSEKLRAARPVSMGGGTAAYEFPDVPIVVGDDEEREDTQVSRHGTRPTSGPSSGSMPSASASMPVSPRSMPSARPSGPHLTPSGRFPSAPASRVLLVDDDEDIRDVVGAMLEAVGLIVEPVSSAEDALERVREMHYDLLVLDWNLPGMTGLELCRHVRREPDLAALPVLFLTAHSSSKDIVEAFASGADDYVAKPFRAPELGARIFGLLRRARLGQLGQTNG